MAGLEKDLELADDTGHRNQIGAPDYLTDAPRYVVPPATAYLQDKREARRRRLSDIETAVNEQRQPIWGEGPPREDGVYGVNQVRFQDDRGAREAGSSARNSRGAQVEDPLLDLSVVDDVYIDRKDVAAIYARFEEDFEPTHDLWSFEYFQELNNFVLDAGSLPKIKLSRDSELPRSHGRIHSLYEDITGPRLTKQDFLSEYGFALALRKWPSLNRAMLKAQIQIEFAGMADRDYTSGPQWFRLSKLFKYWDAQSRIYREHQDEERKMAESWYQRKREEWGTRDDDDAAPRNHRGEAHDEQRQPGRVVIINRRRNSRNRRGDLRVPRRGSSSSVDNDSDSDSDSRDNREVDPAGKKPWGRRIASWFSIREIVDRRIEHRQNFSHAPARREAQRERHLRHAVRTAELPQRIVAAVLGGALLITPMLIMSIHQTKTKSLITSCISVYTFGLGLAFFSSVKIAELLGALAAYAAVLVVFVGVSGP